MKGIVTFLMLMATTAHAETGCVQPAEIIESLDTALKYIKDPSRDMVLAVYKSPSQILREAADEIDNKDRDLRKAGLVRDRLKKYGVCSCSKETPICIE